GGHRVARRLERFAQCRWDGVDGCSDLFVRNSKVIDADAVEAFGVLAHRGITALANLRQDLSHRLDGRGLAHRRARQAGGEIVARAPEIEAGEHRSRLLVVGTHPWPTTSPARSSRRWPRCSKNSRRASPIWQ